eukprot:TRINITY_DN1874_c2_g1_i1.p1 TRINITY_DN1874_c2_g1~~TRINITY_DN1874_c2_g1_i1.p1  ORF type:complete len:114 (-),score=30.38 TRINITY_DN1874_c2_g1_i1:202-510(-)
MEATLIIDQFIQDNKVAIFSKSYCPFCNRTKALFNKLNVEYEVMELDLLENGSELQTALHVKSGQRTVPNVFVGGVHVGGNDDTQAANASGRLQELLDQAGN